MSLVEAFHGAAMAVVRAPWPAMGSSPERGRSGNGGEGQRARLTVLEVGTPRGVAALGRAAGRLLLASVLFVQTVAWGRKEERDKREENEGKEKKKRKKKMGKKFQTWKFSGRKINDNLWSWSKNYFCKIKEYVSFQLNKT
jgi:hypothetical protein